MKSVYELIATKRDGGTLSQKEIATLVGDFTAGRLPDYQMSAFLMAAFINGLNPDETTALTKSMLASGKTVTVPRLDRPLIDKHSTGGVGDKLSLILSPLLAGMGIAVGMFSGRGLGHTGGTLDKLESIPGMKVFHSTSRFASLLRKHHFAITGQTEDIAPADKKIYALRDATGTVESIPLIVASIMSKKLALKSDGIVFDVKCGNGAFMKSRKDASKLSKVLLEVAKANKLPSKALLTDMNQPTGRMIGNLLEVVETVEVLRGGGPADTIRLTQELASRMLVVAGSESNTTTARKEAARELESGAAYERFAAYVKACGGDVRALEQPSRLLRKTHKSVVTSPGSGYITGFATARLGYLGIMLGAGRKRVDDKIDPVAGFELHAKIEDKISKGDRLVTVYGSDRRVVRKVCEDVLKCIEIGSSKPKHRNPVLSRL